MTKTANVTSAPTLMLAAAANAEHSAAQDAARSALDHARRAGELLIEAKDQVEHGSWGAWIEAHVEFAPRTARLYMQIARNWPQLEAASENGNSLPIREAGRLLATSKDPRPGPDDLTPEGWPVGHSMLCSDPWGGDAAWAWPAERPGFFWVTSIRLIEDLGIGHAVSRFLRSDAVELSPEATALTDSGLRLDMGDTRDHDYNPLVFQNRKAQLAAEEGEWTIESRWRLWPDEAEAA